MSVSDFMNHAVLTANRHDMPPDSKAIIVAVTHRLKHMRVHAVPVFTPTHITTALHMDDTFMWFVSGPIFIEAHGLSAELESDFHNLDVWCDNVNRGNYVLSDEERAQFYDVFPDIMEFTTSF